MAKAPAKKAAAKTKATDKTAVEAAQSAAATTMDPQTGMSVQRAEKPTKAAIEAQFKEADAKGQPDDVAEATLSRAIRGY